MVLIPERGYWLPVPDIQPLTDFRSARARDYGRNEGSGRISQGNGMEAGRCTRIDHKLRDDAARAEGRLRMTLNETKIIFHAMYGSMAKFVGK